MISLELAKELRDAGLKWQCKNGDLYYEEGMPRLFCAPWLTPTGALDDKWIFAPRLDQLLAEIKWLFKYDFGLLFERRNGRKYWLMAMYGYESDVYDTPLEAAGQALLWILQEGER